MSRYSRHILLDEIGQDGQHKLNNAKVLVVGAGGLGCPILQYLAGAGIGTLGIIDFDTVEESNLQRQILFGNSSLGKNKAIVAKERLEDLNPNITIIAYPEVLTANNAFVLFENYDIIVDGTDNFDTRYLINDAAVITNKPLVYGAIYKFEGQVSVFNYNDGPNYRCLFPEPPKEGAVANCAEVGVLGVLPGIIGSMQANEVIKIILDLGNILSGKLYCYNAKTLQSSMLQIRRSEIEFEKIIARANDFHLHYNIETCENFSKEITIEDALQKENIQFIDVREPHELPKTDALETLQIPLRLLEHHLDKIEVNREIILFCKSGMRSKQAISILKKHKINNCYSLKGGVNAIVKNLKYMHNE